MWCMTRSGNVPDWMHRQYLKTIVDLDRQSNSELCLVLSLKTRIPLWDGIVDTLGFWEVV